MTNDKDLAMINYGLLKMLANVMNCAVPDLAKSIMTMKQDLFILTKIKSLVQNRIDLCNTVISVTDDEKKKEYYTILKKELDSIMKEGLMT